MIRSAIAAAIAISAACVHAGPRDDALQVVEAWSRAFAAADVDGIVRLYAPEATFFGTSSKTMVASPAGVRAYFDNALLRDRPRTAVLGEPTAVELSDALVLVTGIDTVTGVRDGQKMSATGRISFVVQKRPAGWQIVHFHRSALPQ